MMENSIFWEIADEIDLGAITTSEEVVSKVCLVERLSCREIAGFVEYYTVMNVLAGILDNMPHPDVSEDVVFNYTSLALAITVELKRLERD